MVLKKVDGFEVDTDNELGKGQFSIVFLGRDVDSQVLTAAKRIRAEEDESEQMKEVTKEVEALKKIPPHANIVNFLGTHITDTFLWIFTEY